MFNGNVVETSDLAENIEVKFNDLTAKAQIALFDKDRNALITEVFASRWVQVRDYAKEHIGEFSVEAMNRYIFECMDQNFDSHGIVAEFINILGARVDDRLYIKMVRSNSYRIKLALAKSFNTPNDILNILMQHEIRNDLIFGDNKIAEAIRNNPNYKVNDSTNLYVDTFRSEIQDEARKLAQHRDESFLRDMFEHISSGAIIE